MPNRFVEQLEVAPHQHQIRTKVCTVCEGFGKLKNTDVDCNYCGGDGVTQTTRPVPTIDEEEFRGGLNLESISSYHYPHDVVQFMQLRRNR